MKKAVLFAILGNMIFGLSSLISKVALRTVGLVLLLAIRFTVVFVVLDVLLLLETFKVWFKGKSLGTLIPMSIYQPMIYFPCENYGFQYATSSSPGLVTAIVPAVTFLLVTVILREPFHMNKFAWTPCPVAGVRVISVTGGGDGGVSMEGVSLFTGAVASGSLHTVFSRKCSDTFTATERAYAMFAAGCVSFLVIMFTREGENLVPACVQVCKTPEFVGAALYLTMVSFAAAFLSTNYVTTYLPVTWTSLFANPATLVSIAAGVVSLGETFGAKEVVGAALILCGVFMLNRADNKTAAVWKQIQEEMEIVV